MNNELWFRILLLLSLLLISLMIFRKTMPSISSKEGFTQNDKFVLKQNQDVYDTFYVELHDKMNLPHRRVPYELKTILETTQAEQDNSVFLDIGSGTGFVVNELQELGYSAFGVEKSAAMVLYSQTKYTNLPVKTADVENRMIFERGQFSHILCLYFTIYEFEFKQKLAFFKNCYHWLKPGGFMVIHLVDKTKYDKTIPAGKDIIFGSPQRYNDSLITDKLIDFNDFKYRAFYETVPNSSKVFVTESFIDSHSDNIRQNERVLYMDEIQEILNLATVVGFIIHGKFNIKEGIGGDIHQYLYFFERPNSA